MRIWLVCIALVGCKTDDTRYMINIPTGGGPVGGEHVDSNTGGGDALGDGGGMLAGKVCLVGDARLLTTCASGGAGGFTVTLGGKTTTTLDSGAFSIATPSGTNLVWQVTGSTIVTTAMSYSVANTIPVLDTNTYLDLEGGNGVLPVQGEGAILARVISAGAPLADATATTSPVGAYAPFYDGSSATQWNQNKTGANGVVWVPNIPVGAATFTVTPSGGSGTLVGGIPILDEGITIVVADI